MTTVLIADSNKASIVMSSEVFKDKIPGARVLIAASGKECLDLVSKENPDVVVVDFDLPDADGASLVSNLRKRYAGPIFLTAFAGREIEEVVNQELFIYNDCSSILTKPISVATLNERIDRFLMNRFRIDRRFDASFGIEIRKKAAGQGTRTPKYIANCVNISLGGIAGELSEIVKMTSKDELNIVLPARVMKKKMIAKKAAPAPSTASRKKPSATTPGLGTSQAKADLAFQASTETISLRGKIAWQNKKLIGVRFDKLSEKQHGELALLLKSLIASV